MTRHLPKHRWPPMDPILVSINEGGRILSLSRSSVNRLRDDGTLTTVESGPKRRSLIFEEVKALANERIAVAKKAAAEKKAAAS